jgi:membrane associated rhomboid family serine protease
MPERSRAGRRPSETRLTLADVGRELKLHGWILGVAIALLWAIQLANAATGHALVVFGIHPREPIGLLGVLAAPLLHGSFDHLIANTIPFLVLGWLVLIRETWHFFVVSAITILIAGLGTWLVGQSGSVHVGASGLIFGWLGYLLLGGLFERRIGTIVGSVVVAVGYGSLVLGVLPGTPGVSWEGHLFGFLGGVLCAWILARRPGNDERA